MQDVQVTKSLNIYIDFSLISLWKLESLNYCSTFYYSSFALIIEEKDNSYKLIVGNMTIF